MYTCFVFLLLGPVSAALARALHGVASIEISGMSSAPKRGDLSSASVVLRFAPFVTAKGLLQQ